MDVVGLTPPESGRLWSWRQRVLPRLARESGADALHVFSSAFPLGARLPVIQTVHEAPWLHGTPENAGLKHRAWVKLGAKFAAATCTPSQGVANDLTPGSGRDRGLHVVPWGVGSEFTPRENDSDVRLKGSLPDLGGEPIVLTPGATRPKKRLELVCEGALAAGFQVLCTGELTSYVENLQGRFANLVHAGHLTDDLLPALYRRASCVAVLSQSEGFALPVLEALASGTAVVVARGTVQADTAGDAGYAVDANDADETGRAMTLAAAHDPIRREAGLLRAGAHTWDHTAARLVDVWRSVL